MDLVTSIAVDGSGNVYATGTTGNTNFPTAGTPFQSTFAGMIGTSGSKTAGCLGTYPGGIERSGNFPCGDVFVSELNSALTSLVNSTYVGSSGTDIAFDISFDAGGHPWITGMTQYSAGGLPINWPTTANAFQLIGGGSGVQMFIMELDAALKNNLYSSYYGSGPDQWSYKASVNAAGTQVAFGGLSSAQANQGGATPTSANCFDSSGANTCHNLIGTSSAFVGVLSLSASQANTPSCTPLPGTYGVTLSITCTFSSAGGFGCYTTDGTIPASNEPTNTNCAHGTKYTTAIPISSTTTLNVISGAPTLTDSNINSGTYTITIPLDTAFSTGVSISGKVAWK